MHRRSGEVGEYLRLYFEKFSAERAVVPHPVPSQPPVARLIRPQRQQVGVAELGHAVRPPLGPPGPPQHSLDTAHPQKIRPMPPPPRVSRKVHPRTPSPDPILIAGP